MTFQTFLFIVTILYVCQAVVFLIGLKRNRDQLQSSAKLSVSVIIAARNEEDNLYDCLESVANQIYPNSLYEIIIINDGSTDGTETICNDFIKRYPNIKSIQVKDDTIIRGKANALAQGIEASGGEIILITDADCTVPKTWVEQTANRYDPEVGLIGGFTLQKATTPFEGMQSLDWTFILGMAAATVGLGNPLGSIGNNLSFRRSAYDQVGGYRKLKFSVTEDYTVVQAIVGSNKWKYLYPIDLKHLVESKPCPNFQSLISQKHRWGKGGLDMKPTGLAIMLIGFLMHLSPFVMLFWGGVFQAAAALMIKFIADYVFLYQILRRLDRKEDLRWFYWFEIYFIIYVSLLPFLVFFGGKVKWKGREY
ncbi:MAG: glycosyltransferase [Bacteroidota bacterium]|jgi:cellulose synthase/poly-beta-1,6-N-acetylglucosamine synthase-like glycosyltransferase